MFDDDDNIFRAECRRFEWDVRILIDRGLHAALETLKQELNCELDEITNWSKKPGVTLEEVAKERAYALALFHLPLRLMLVSRLDFVLRRMARLGDSLASCQPGKYKGRFSVVGFGRLWNEYEARFGFDFITDAKEIDFVEPMTLASFPRWPSV